MLAMAIIQNISLSPKFGTYLSSVYPLFLVMPPLMSIQQKSIAKLSPAQLNWLSLTMKLGSNQLPPPTHLRKFTVNPFDLPSIQSQLAKKFYKLQLFLIFSFTYI